MKGTQFEAALAAIAQQHSDAGGVDSWGNGVVGFAIGEGDDLDMGDDPVVQLQTTPGDADLVSAAELLSRYRSSKTSDWDEMWVQDGDESDVQEIVHDADTNRVYFSC